MTREIPLTQAVHEGCGCHHANAEPPEIDAHALPHAIRHAAILGAVASLAPGAALVVKAPHDPLPLLAQIAQIHGDAIEVEYLDRTPEVVRVRLTARA